MKNRISLRGRALAHAGGLLPLLLAAVMLSACSKTKAEPSAGAVVETNTCGSSKLNAARFFRCNTCFCE